jgi:molecular chaperone GrpE
MRDITDQYEDFETVGADAPTDTDARAADRGTSPAADSEADILRSELENTAKRLSALETEVAEAKDRFMRSRAEFDTFRRRMADELNMAREAGLDSVVIPVLNVYDDLERAVTAAEATPDPSTILPGVIAVRDGLIRNLEALGIRRIGGVGEQFDPSLHEALAVVPPNAQAAENVIAQVYEIGFVKGDRLIRPAKVVVAKSS